MLLSEGTTGVFGHDVSDAGVQAGTRKVRAVSDFPAAKNVHGVKQFVGKFFRNFIRNFAVMARPLTDLLKKDALWSWGRGLDHHMISYSRAYSILKVTCVLPHLKNSTSSLAEIPFSLSRITFSSPPMLKESLTYHIL